MIRDIWEHQTNPQFFKEKKYESALCYSKLLLHHINELSFSSSFGFDSLLDDFKVVIVKTRLIFSRVPNSIAIFSMKTGLWSLKLLEDVGDWWLARIIFNYLFTSYIYEYKVAKFFIFLKSTLHKVTKS